MPAIRSQFAAHQRFLFPVVILLLFGFYLRTMDIGAEPFRHDEVLTDFLAFQAGHNGQWSPLGVRSSVSFNQSPFFHDVFSVAFAFSPDPRIARLYLGVLNFIGMAVLYAL